MLERFGVAVSPNAMKVENIAAVVVTAEIGPYMQNGGRIDVVASSIGDARSLQGGTLLPTPLRGPDGAVVALAQGALSIGGFGAGGGGNSVAGQSPHRRPRAARRAGAGGSSGHAGAGSTTLRPGALRARLRLGLARRGGDQHGARRRRGARARRRLGARAGAGRVQGQPGRADRAPRAAAGEHRRGGAGGHQRAHRHRGDGRRRPHRRRGRGARQPVGADLDPLRRVAAGAVLAGQTPRWCRRRASTWTRATTS